MSTLQNVTIFLASSAELKDDRDAFRIFIAGLNDKLIHRHVYLQVIQWERFMDAISDTRMQNEYNAALEKADLAVCLFFTKVGKYTEEEFDTAYQTFMATGKPRIWTYFKTAPVSIGALGETEMNSLFQFKKKLNGYGHFYSQYDSTADLQNKFRDQLDLVLPELLIAAEPGKAPETSIAEKQVSSQTTALQKGAQPTAAPPTNPPPANRAIDEIELLLDEPSEQNTGQALEKLDRITKNTNYSGYVRSVKADWIKYREDKLSGLHVEGRFNYLLRRILEILGEYKNSIR